MPALDSLAKKLNKKGLTVITVSQDIAGPAIVEPFLMPMMLKNILVWYDDKNKSFRQLGLRGLPTTILISPKGLVVAKLEGAAEWNEGLLLEQIERIIGDK